MELIKNPALTTGVIFVFIFLNMFSTTLSYQMLVYNRARDNGLESYWIDGNNTERIDKYVRRDGSAMNYL